MLTPLRPYRIRASPWATAGWVALLVLVVALSLRSHGAFLLGSFHDDAKYVLLARSLVEADSYGVHIGPVPLPNAYPFGFPLLLLPLIRACPDQLDCLTLLPLAATLINVTLLYWGWPILSRTSSRWWALAVAASYALHPWVLVQTNMVLSEPVFTTFVLAALLATERGMRVTPPRTAGLVVVGWLLAWVPFTRTAGAVLGPVIALRTMWPLSRDGVRRGTALAAGVLLLLVPVLAFTSLSLTDLLPQRYLEAFVQPSLRGHDRSEDSLATRALRGLDAYASEYVRQSVLPFGGGERERAFGQRLGIADLPRVIGFCVTGIVLIGAFAHPGLAPSVLLFEMAYAPVPLLWYARHTRLLYPIQPLLCFQLLLGMRALFRVVMPRQRATRLGISAPDLAVTGLAVALAALSIVRSWEPHARSTQHTRDYRVGTTWLRAHTPTDAIVAAEEPATIHVYTQRATIPQPPVRSVEELRTFLTGYGVDYLLIGPWGEWRADGQPRYTAETERNFLPLVQDLVRRGELTLVYDSEPRERVQVYRVEQIPPLPTDASQG